MSEIPQDVMDAARSWTVEWYGGYEDRAASFIKVRDLIARAIFAERERCAQIADNFDEDEPGYLDRADDPGSAGAAWASDRIASLIRQVSSAGLSPSQAPATGKADTAVGLPDNSHKE